MRVVLLGFLALIGSLVSATETAAPASAMYTLVLEREGAPKGRSFVVESGTTLSFEGGQFRVAADGAGLVLQELGEGDVVSARLAISTDGGSGALGTWQATLTPMDAATAAKIRQMRETSRLSLVRALQASKQTEPLATVEHRHRVDLQASDSLLASDQPRTLPQTLVFNEQQQLILLSTRFSTLEDLKAEIEAARIKSDAPALTLSQALAAFRLRDGSEIRSVPKGGLYLLQAWAQWCAPCLKERDALTGYFQANPDSDWVWFHAEADAMAYRQRSGKAGD